MILKTSKPRPRIIEMVGVYGLLLSSQRLAKLSDLSPFHAFI